MMPQSQLCASGMRRSKGDCPHRLHRPCPHQRHALCWSGSRLQKVTRCAWVMQLGSPLCLMCHSLLVSCLVPAEAAEQPISK